MAESYKRKCRLGIYAFKDAEIVNFAVPYGVFSVAEEIALQLQITSGDLLVHRSSVPCKRFAGKRRTYPQWIGSIFKRRATEAICV